MQSLIDAASSVLTHCDREPIHIPGAIQSNGLLIALSSDWYVSHISANAPEWAGRPVKAILGARMRDILGGDAIDAIENCLAALEPNTGIEHAASVELFDNGRLFDLAIHRVDSTIILECQLTDASSGINPTSLVGAMVARLRRTIGFADLCWEGARQIKTLTGFDRVMLYKFHRDGSGEVITEALRPGVDSFLGLRYPASDIPRQARALYERKWLRIIADVGAAPVPLIKLDPASEPLDLSASTLRAVSPVHIEYLRNMGVGASMSVSILRNGKLWGLIACHHMTPRPLNFFTQYTAELFGQVFSLLLESRERDLDAEYEASARAIHDQLISAAGPRSARFNNVADLIEAIRSLIPCDGIGILLAGKATLEGSTPTQAEFHGLVGFLNRMSVRDVYATNELSKHHAPALGFTENAAGMLAIPISRTPPDYVVFFRREIASAIIWAGNPNKQTTGTAADAGLTPRKSFEAWQEIVRNQSSPWTEPELRIAASLRVTLIEIILRLAGLAERKRKEAEARQAILIAELNHRVRNILSLIQGLVEQGEANTLSVDAYAGVLKGRVHALARAHAQITSQNWGPGALSALIAAEGAAYVDGQSVRIRCSGVDVLLVPAAFATLALVLHELMTNSAKYGALQGIDGHVDLSWKIDEANGLILLWQEIGGPPVAKPDRIGFGTTLIERSIPHDLQGTTSIHYNPSGVHVQMTVPAEYVILPGAAALPAAEIVQGPTARLSGHVLLVEDNFVIALDAEEMLLELGAIRVDIASRVSEAMALIAAKRPDFAVLDVDLGVEMSLPIAMALREISVPFCFATGYGEAVTLPPEAAATPILSKPYSIEALSLAIGKVLQTTRET